MTKAVAWLTLAALSQAKPEVNPTESTDERFLFFLAIPERLPPFPSRALLAAERAAKQESSHHSPTRVGQHG